MKVARQRINLVAESVLTLSIEEINNRRLAVTVYYEISGFQRLRLRFQFLHPTVNIPLVVVKIAQ